MLFSTTTPALLLWLPFVLFADSIIGSYLPLSFLTLANEICFTD